MQYTDSPSRLPQTLLRMLLNLRQASSESDPAELLRTLIEGFGATGAAFWTDATQPVALDGPEQAAFSNAAAQEAVARTLHNAATTGTLDVSLQSAPFASGRQLLVLTYVDSARRPHCVQLLLPGDRPANEQLLSLQAAKLISHQPTLSTPTAEASQSGSANPRLLATLIGFHGSLDLQETTYRIANDSRHVLDCDRVSVLLQDSNGYRLHAASGQVQPDRRANTVRELEELVRHVATFGERFTYPMPSSTTDGRASSTELAPQIEQALNEYLEVSPARALRIVPLFEKHSQQSDEDDPVAANSRSSKSEQPFGALVFEHFRDRSFDDDAVETPWLTAAATDALLNARTHQHVFLLPVWRTLGRWWNEPRGRVRRRLVLAAVLGAAIAMWFVPARFEVVVDGQLRPVERRHVFATANGVVQDVLVKHGDQVAADQPLVMLENPELTRNLDELLGQTQIATQQLASIKSLRLSGTSLDDSSGSNNDNRLAAEQQRLRMQLENLRKQYELLESQKQQMQIRSPCDGMVVTWDVEQAIASRPLERGQQIMTVANESGPWQLELHVKDRQAGHLREAQQTIGPDLPVAFALGTEPRGRYRGTLNHVALSSQIRPDEGAAVKVTVSIEADQLPAQHDGAAVRAKIDCGRRSLGYVWFHQLIDLVQSRLLFYLR